MKPDKKNRLGRVDLDVTALSLGTVALGNLFGAIPEEQATATINAAWDAGIRFYDTAPLYGHGIAELRVGAALRNRKRDDFVLASKVGRKLKPRPRAEIQFGGWVDVTPFEASRLAEPRLVI